MVVECTARDRTIQEFAEQVHMIWEQWLPESQQTAKPGEAELVRKELLKDMRSKFLDSLGDEVVTQIMRSEAAKYNYIRSK